MCFPHGCPLILHTRPLLQGDSFFSLLRLCHHLPGSSSMCECPPHLFEGLTLTLSPLDGHPVTQAQTWAAILYRCISYSVQTPVPSSGLVWPPYPCTRYGSPPSTAYLVALGPNSSRKAGKRRERSYSFFGDRFLTSSMFLCIFSPWLSFTIPLLWANFTITI